VSNNGRLTFTIRETAAKLGISKNLAYDLARRGELPGVIKLGQKRLVVSKLAIERLLQGEDIQKGNGGG
jgi:excisionase family DNA binding protein